MALALQDFPYGHTAPPLMKDRGSALSISTKMVFFSCTDIISHIMWYYFNCCPIFGKIDG